MNKKQIIIGLIVLVIIGVIAGVGWAISKKFSQKQVQKQTGVGVQEEAEGTKTVKEKEIKDLTDEEFLKEITEMAYIGGCIFIPNEKDELVWNPPFKRLLQLELNFTTEQLEKFQEFLRSVREWEDLKYNLESKEDDLKTDPKLLAEKYDKGLLKEILEKRESGQLSKEIASLKNEVSMQGKIVMDELSKIRGIFDGKEKQLLEWVEGIIDLYGELQLSGTPRPKSDEDLNSIKTQYFENERYKKSLEEKVSKSLLLMKTLNLTSSQEAKIKTIIKDFIKKTDDLKAQLCAIQYGYLIEKPEKITKSTVHLIEKAKKEKSQSIVENIAKLIEIRDSQIKTHLTKEQRLKFGEEE